MTGSSDELIIILGFLYDNLYWILLVLSIILIPNALLLFFRKNGLSEYLQPPSHGISKSWLLLIPVYFIFLFSYWLGYDKIAYRNMGNILIHVVGGGFTVAIIVEFLLQNMVIKFNWRWQIVFLIACCCIFSVFNELMEALIDLFKPYHKADGWDSWRDIIANFVGAGIGYFLIQYCKAVYYYFGIGKIGQR